jgi:hypothetical protein
MKSHTGSRARRALGAFAALVALDGCTFVYVEGDHNSISDTGGHGGGVTLPQGRPGPAGPLKRLRESRRGAPGESLNRSIK